MKNDYSKEAFLLKIFKEELNHSQNIIKYSKKPNGKNLRIEEAVRRYLAIQERLNELNFDLSNPVDIIPQYSYDNSVNLILNDGKNPPRLINSRFSAIGKNKYEIVDRKGDNDTNIYDQGD